MQPVLLLPVPYFLLTFTLPAELRQFAHAHPRCFYDLLFRASAAATQQLARDPRFSDGQIGLVGVLHTWTRDLRYHPHIRYLVPAGGLADDGLTWHTARHKFFLPVKALSRLFRGHFQDALKKTTCYAAIPTAVWSSPWVVHCKPVRSGERALKYLASHIFRVALSNRGLIKLENDQVTFRYKDAASGQTKFCTLPALAFIPRFLQRVLPSGFMKVRYYGLFAPGHRKALSALRQRLGHATPQPTGSATAVAPSGIPQAADDVLRYPLCGEIMVLRQVHLPVTRPPP